MGFPFARFFQALTALAPIVVPLLPGGAVLAPFVPVLVKGIADAEQDPGLTNPEKRDYVVRLVIDAAQGANTLQADTVGDPLLLAQSAGHAVDAVITSINAVKVAHDKLPVP